MGQQALETGTRTYAQFLMTRHAPILSQSGDCAADGGFSPAEPREANQSLQGNKIIDILKKMRSRTGWSAYD